MESERKFTRKEIEGCNTRNNTVIIIDNVVYDVTQFLEEHPGGAERLLEQGGGDASRCFHQVGHSEAALQWRRQFRAGSLVEADVWPEEPRATSHAAAEAPAAPPSLRALLDAGAPPLLLAALATLLYLYLF